MGQLADAQARLAQATTEEEQTRMRLGMSVKELKTLEARWREVEREAGEGQHALEAKKAEVARCRKKVADCGWNEVREKEGDMALRNAKEELRRHTEVHIHSCHDNAPVLTTSKGTRRSQAAPACHRLQLHIPFTQLRSKQSQRLGSFTSPPCPRRL